MFHFKSSTVKSSVSEKEKDVPQQTIEDQIPVYSNDSGNMYNQTEKMKEALRKENDGRLQNEINKEKGKQTKGVEEKLYKLNPRKELDTEEKGMEASQGRQFFFQTLWLVKHVHQNIPLSVIKVVMPVQRNYLSVSVRKTNSFEFLNIGLFVKKIYIYT